MRRWLAISDGTWAEVSQHVADPNEQVEWAANIANRIFASIVLRNPDVPLQDGVMALPPDSVRPASAEGR